MTDDGVCRALLDAAPDAVLVASEAGEIGFANRRAVELFGRRGEEMIGTAIELHVPGILALSRSDQPEPSHGATAPAAERRELCAQRGDGSQVAVEVRLSPLPTPAGRCVAAYIRDISAWHETTAALRVAEQQLRRAFDGAPIGMALVATDGRWLQVNKALADIVGYTPEALLQLRFRDITHPDDVAADVTLMDRTLGGEMSGYQITKRYIHRDRRIVWARLTVSLVRDARGVPLHFVSQVEDVTHQHEVEQQLHEAQRRVQALFDNIPAGLSLRDLDGRYLAVNAYAARSLNQPADELVGTDPGEHLDAATRDQVRRDDMRVAATRKPVVTNIQLPDAAGVDREFHVVRYPVVDDEGSVTALGTFSLDVTEQREVERARADALADLADAQRLARIGSWRWDTAADRATWTEEMYRIFGRDPAAGPATSEAFFAYVHPDDRERLAAGYARAFGGGPAFELDYRIVRTDGSEGIIHALGHRDEKQPGVYIGTVQDVTALREAERRLDQAQQRFHAAFDNAPIGMAITDSSGRYQLVNPAFCRLTGRSAEDLAKRAIADITHPEDRARDYEIMSVLLRGEARSMHREKRYVRADGATLWVQVHVTLLRDDGDTSTARFLIQVLDVTARRQQADELRRLADHDPLTGLLNRRGFERLLEQHLAQVHRYGARGALIVVDLDHFKQLNDAHGHQAGDEVLREVASVLTRRLRGSDVAARLGGDEFVVLLTEASADGAAQVAASIVRDGATRIAALGERPTPAVTLSAGTLMLTPASRTTAEALAAADAAMYEAKAGGRNRHVLHHAASNGLTGLSPTA